MGSRQKQKARRRANCRSRLGSAEEPATDAVWHRPENQQRHRQPDQSRRCHRTKAMRKREVADQTIVRGPFSTCGRGRKKQWPSYGTDSKAAAAGCSAAKALTGIEPNRQTQPKFERNQTYHRKDRFGISEKKKHLQERASTQRSLHFAPPDFLSRTVTLINFMRFPLRETAPVVLANRAK